MSVKAVAPAKPVGIETIKRQMDNLQDMVTELQIQMGDKRDNFTEETLEKFTPLPNNTSDSESNLQTTTAEEDDYREG